MSTNRVVGDALWRALCPSVDAKFLIRAIESPLLLTQNQTHATRRQCTNGPSRECARAIHTTGPLALQAAPERAPLANAISKQPPPRTPNQRHTSTNPPSSQIHQGNEPVTAADLLDLSIANPLPGKALRAKTPVIYEALRAMRSGRKALGPRIRALVEYLVKVRGERPNLFLYEALVTANWDPTTGSAGELSAIMREMKKEGIEMSQGFYHCALKVGLFSWK